MRTDTIRYRTWLMLAAAGLLIQSSWAQETPSTAEGNDEHHPLAYLTPEERQKLKTDREAVFAANPDLKSQGQALHEQWKTIKTASPEEKKAFFQQARAYEKTLHKEMIQNDPNIKPVLEKIRQHRHERREQHEQNNSTTGNT